MSTNGWETPNPTDCGYFRSLLNKIHEKKRKRQAGARPRDVVMMFKGLVVQNLYGLSDDQLEYQIEDRRSFQQFLGIDNHQPAPDAKTFWAFKSRLAALGLMESLFEQFSLSLNQAGYITRKDQIVVSIIPALELYGDTTGFLDQIGYFLTSLSQ